MTDEAAILSTVLGKFQKSVLYWQYTLATITSALQPFGDRSRGLLSDAMKGAGGGRMALHAKQAGRRQMGLIHLKAVAAQHGQPAC